MIDNKVKVMYMGPTIRGVVKSGAVFAGGIPANLEKVSKEKPIIKNLIVPLSSIVETKKALDTEGTVESVAYDAISSIPDNEIQQILKGE